MKHGLNFGTASQQVDCFLIRLFEFADERNELAHQDLGWLAFIGQFKSLLVLAVEQRNTNLR